MVGLEKLTIYAHIFSERFKKKSFKVFVFVISLLILIGSKQSWKIFNTIRIQNCSKKQMGGQLFHETNKI